MQRPSGVIGGRVERFEVVVVGLDLGTLGDLVSHADEYVLDLSPRAGDEMQMTERQRAAGQGDVDTVALQAVHQLIGLERGMPALERLFQLLLDQVAEATYTRPFRHR